VYGWVRRALLLNDGTWEVLQEVSKFQQRDVEEILKEAIREYLRKQGYSNLYINLMLEATFCDDAENEELTLLIDSIPSEELQIEKEIEVET